MKKYLLNRGMLLIFVVCVIAIAVFFYYQRYLSQGSQTDNETSTLVQVIPLTHKTLSHTLTAYGTLQTDPVKTWMITAPVGGQIRQIFITTGQRIKKDAPLIDFAPDPSAHLTYQQNLSDALLAEKELARTKRLYQLQLATRSQMETAQKTLLDAKAALHAAQVSESNRSNKPIRAPFDGIITQLNINPGDRVQAGANLLQIGSDRHLVVHLGITPDDSSSVKIGASGTIRLLSHSNTQCPAQVTQVGQQVNSQTHLIDVWATLSDACEGLFPGQFIQADIVLSSQNIWSVPSSAVLKDEKGEYIYRIQNQQAARVAITSLTTAADWVGIQGSDLKLGDQIVTQGNYELHEGMHVRIEQP